MLFITTLKILTLATLAIWALVRFVRLLERDERKRRRVARVRVSQQRRREAWERDAWRELHIIGPATVRVRGGSIEVLRAEPVDAKVMRVLRETRALCPPRGAIVETTH